jgi:hypothetical protein
MIMVHSLGNEIPGSRLVVEIHKSVGLKLFSLPETDQILVAEPGRMPVMTQMVKVLIASFQIHVPGIPIPVHGDALRPPVAPKTQLRVPKPIRALVSPQRFKIRFKFVHRASFKDLNIAPSSGNVERGFCMAANINTYVEESIAKFVVGDINIDRDWTTFQNNLRNMGLDRYLQIIQNT